MISARIRRLGLLAAFITVSASALAMGTGQQIKIDRALNSPTLSVKYSGVHAALVELRLNGESFGTRTMDMDPSSGETTFSLDVLALKDGDNEVEIRLYDKEGNVVGSEKTTITTDSDTKGPVFLSTPKLGENVSGPVEITVGFGRDFKNSYVSFFIDNQFKSMTNFPPYTYTWDTTRESNGWHELEAWVVDDTSSTFKTRKVRVFVNNPGGHTYRIDPAATTTAALAAAPPKTVAVTKAVKKAAKKNIAKPLPKATPLDLTPSANQVSATTEAAVAPIKTIAEAKSAIAVAKTQAIAPEVALTIPNEVDGVLAAQSASAKPALMTSPTAAGPRLMTPTGKHAAAQAVAPKPAPTKPAAPQALTKASAEVAPKPTIERAPITQPTPAPAPAKPVETPTPKAAQVAPAPQPKIAPAQPETKVTGDAAVQAAVLKPAPETPVPAPSKPAEPVLTGSELALLPSTKTEAAVTTFHPLNMDVTGEGSMVRRNPDASKPAPPVVPEPEKPAPTNAPMTIRSLASTDSVVKAVATKPNVPVAVKPLARHLIAVTYGTRLPIKSTYTIVYNGKPLAFDVAPSIYEGVPVTPFRHLMEKAGGQVDWKADDKEVVASADGKNIWLKIGDQFAKIDSSAIKLEMAPFIQQGRTIVPLSFIEKALNVNVDYDKTTGHVLIMPKS